MAAKQQRKASPSKGSDPLTSESSLEKSGFKKPLPREYNQDVFVRALNGSQKDFWELIEREKPILFDYAMRMTGEVNRSWDTIQDQVSAINTTHLQQCGNAFVFRQALLMGLRHQLLSIWHRDTSRLENAAYVSLANPETENLKTINVSEPSKARDFDREFHQLPGLEREALWLKARLQASLEEIVQVMSIRIQEVERCLVAALFRLENKSYGCDPESLVARLPFHPIPAPMTQVTMELSQVMQGIRKSQRATSRSLNFLGAIVLFFVSFYLIIEVFFRPDKDWLIETFFERVKEALGLVGTDDPKMDSQRTPSHLGKDRAIPESSENIPGSQLPTKEVPSKSERPLDLSHP